MSELSMVIQNAQLKDRAELADIGIEGGVISVVAPAGTLRGGEIIDAQGGFVSESFTDPHFHLDKTMSRALFGAERFEDAFGKAHEVKTHFTVEDVKKRAMYALNLAVCHGMGAIKAQVDVDYATGLTSLEGVMEAAREYRDMITVEPIAFPQEGMVCDDKQPELLREALKMGCRYIGGLPEFEASGRIEDQRKHVEMIFDLAEEFGVDIDCHADYTDRVQYKTLEMVADETIRRHMEGHVCVDHCTALAVYGDDEAKRVMDKLARAQIHVIVLPIANLQMLGGEKRTPCNRGSSRILELLDAGINVSAGSDNMFDIWYRFNCMDPVLTGLMACLSGGMKTEQEVKASFDMITCRAARTMGRWDKGIMPGAPADLCIHSAKSIVDIYRMIPGSRIVIKNGRKVAGCEKTIWRQQG